MTPKLSIIIATFNAAKTLSVAMDSVMNQTFQDWECIIVDGASIDCTIDIIKSYVEQDSRFRYISEPDKGIYDAFNKGWKMAKGEWIIYLGSDDELSTNGLMLLSVEFMNTDIVYGDVKLRYRNGKMKLQKAKDASILDKSTISPCCHQSLAMKKELFSILGGFDLSYKIMADKDLLIKAYKKGYVFKRIAGIISYFSLGGISQNGFKANIESYHIYRKYHNRLESIIFLIKSIIKKIIIIVKNKIT